MGEYFAAKAQQAAEDPEAAARYARCYNGHARSYRQALLLKARLKREIALGARDAAAARDAAEPREGRIAWRKVEVHREVERLVWQGLDLSFDVEMRDLIVAAVDRRLAEVAASPGLLTEPIDALVDQATAVLDRDLEPIFAARAAARPANPAPADPVVWRGSG